MRRIKAENYNYFMEADLSKYIGDWVAICNAEIVASGSNAKEVYTEAKKKHPFKKPLLSKIPENGTMVL